MSLRGLRQAYHSSAVLDAIRGYRKGGLKVAALTNNWPTTNKLQVAFESLVEEFDVFVESEGRLETGVADYERVSKSSMSSHPRLSFLMISVRTLSPHVRWV